MLYVLTAGRKVIFPETARVKDGLDLEIEIEEEGVVHQGKKEADAKDREVEIDQEEGHMIETTQDRTTAEDQTGGTEGTEEIVTTEEMEDLEEIVIGMTETEEMIEIVGIEIIDVMIEK